MTISSNRRLSTGALTLLAAGWIAAGLAANPAFASGMSVSDDAAVAAMPHSKPITNGTPVVTETADGKPEISYTGPAHGNLSPGVAHLEGQSGSGSPIIRYTPRPHHHAAEPGTATATPMPVQASMPSDVHMLLDQAKQALQARRMDQARDRLERAETALLNARVDGENGDAGALRDMASARAAVAMNNQGAALRDLAQVMKALDNPSG